MYSKPLYVNPFTSFSRLLSPLTTTIISHSEVSPSVSAVTPRCVVTVRSAVSGVGSGVGENRGWWSPEGF